MNIFTKIAGAGVAAAAVVAGVAGGLAPAAHAAEPTPAQAHVATQAQTAAQTTGVGDVTRGFHVSNWTQHDLRVIGVGGDPANELDAPPVGSILHPNDGYLDYELTWHWMATSWRNIYLEEIDAQGNPIGVEFGINIGINPEGEPYAQDSSTTPGHSVTVDQRSVFDGAVPIRLY